jgi:hypothetical protein
MGAQMFTSTPQTKRLVFKPAAGNSQRCHRHPAVGPSVEHEYIGEGAWAYLAAWEVHRARVFGRCEVKSGMAAPVDRLVGEVMSQEPYRSFGSWITVPRRGATRQSNASVTKGRI